MITKELIDARWKVIIGAVLGVCLVLVSAFTYDLIASALTSEQKQSISNAAGNGILERLTNYGIFAWSQTYSPTNNTGVILIIVAALIGASLIAGEVSKGTIFLLLSRPLSREQIVLTKFGVGAALMLGMNVLVSVVLAIASSITGHPQNLGGIAISALLFWLGTVFVLGVAAVFSVVFSDVLRPLALAAGVLILLSLPAFFPHGGDWVLPTYWSSLPAFLGQEFPLKALVISLIAAAVPVVLAVPLFKRQQY